MEFYDFNKDVYNRIVKIVKFRFYREIKDTGIVLNEILLAENLVTNISFIFLYVTTKINHITLDL